MADQILVINVGSDERNHRRFVNLPRRSPARLLARHLPSASIVRHRQAGRSYRVDFSLFRELAPDHQQPLYSLGDSISSLVSGLRSIDFDDADFRRSASLIRLNASPR